jgi:autotransporter-associated beta strand protein
MELVNSAVQLDNGYLSNVSNRLPAGINIVSKGGTFTLNGAAGQVARQALGTLTLDLGLTTINNNAGGNGANEVTYANIVRQANSGTMINFGQNLGFLGTAGDTTTGIRNIISGINGQPVSLTNGIIGGWAIGNGDHFATYSTTTGVGLLSNTADGFATYGGTDLSTATAASGAVNYNDGTSRTIAAGTVVNAIRNAPAATQTLTLNGGLTIASGGLLTNAGVGITYNGGTLTSGSEALYAWINQNTTTINSAIIGTFDLVKGGSGALTLGGANSYSGKTFVDAGTLSIGATVADGSTTVAVPGDLMIHGGAVATVTVPRSIKETANVTITGSGRLNMRDAAATVETLRSITFRDGGGATGTMNVDRGASRPDSTLNLTAPTAITANNSNPSTGVPYFGVNLGKLGFTGSGASDDRRLFAARRSRPGCDWPAHRCADRSDSHGRIDQDRQRTARVESHQHRRGELHRRNHRVRRERQHTQERDGRSARHRPVR